MREEDSMRIVFMGTPEFSVPILSQLITNEYDIVAVYTQPDRPQGRGRRLIPSAVKQEALKHHLEIQQPAKLRETTAQLYLTELHPDIIIVASYGQILPQQILDIPRFGCLNVHPSLLPLYRGSSPISTAILNGDSETGVTIMLMDAGLDTGHILTQTSIAIETTDTSTALASRLAIIGARLLIDTIPGWINNQIQPVPQDNTRATHTRTISKQEGKIDWNLSAVEIWRQVRAFQPWPGSYTSWQNKVFKIIDAFPIESHDNDREPGTIIAINNISGTYAGVITGKGVLALQQVQLEGKRPVSISDFLKGHKDFIGTRLGEQ